MTGVRIQEDASLPTFDVPSQVPIPGRIDPELAVVGQGSARTLRLQGTRSVLQATESGDVTGIRFQGTLGVGRITGAPGTVANVMVSPGRARRERIGPGGSLEETLLVAPQLPLAVLHWSRWTGGTLSLHALPGAPIVRYRTAPRGLTIGGPQGDSVLTLHLLGPPAATWSFEPHPEGGAWVRAAPADGPSTLILVHGSPDAVRTALRGVAHLKAHEERAVGPVDAGVLRLETGSAELDESVAWLAGRLWHGIREAATEARTVGALEGIDWLWTGLGAVAIGDEEGAATCVRILGEQRLDHAAALLAGRIALTTGRSDLALRWARSTAEESSAAAGDPALRSLALRTLADGLRFTAPDAFLDRLRALASSGAPDAPEPPPGSSEPQGLARGPAPRPIPDRGSGSIRLPTVRGSSTQGTPGVGSWLSARLSGNVDAGSALPAIPRPAALAWTRFSNDPQAGWTAWRAAVATGFPRGPYGAAAWDPLDVPERPPAETGLLLAGLAHGWLGAAPDAPVGRLTLSPVVPDHVTRFRVSGIPVGDARLSLRFERSDDAFVFELDADRGRVPPFVAFTVRVPSRVSTVLIDGAPADPRVVPMGQYDEIQLQTPVDGPRRIEVKRTDP